MTREEEIINQSHKYRLSNPSKNKNFTYNGTDLEESYESGAKWADKHPIDVKIKEILLAYTKWLDKRGFFKEELQCDFPHQIETFLEMKGEEK